MHMSMNQYNGIIIARFCDILKHIKKHMLMHRFFFFFFNLSL